MLGRLELDVDECITLYRKMMGSVFEKKANTIPVKLRSGEIQNRFESQNLKAAIKDILKDKGLGEDDMYDNGAVRTCRT